METDTPASLPILHLLNITLWMYYIIRLCILYVSYFKLFTNPTGHVMMSKPNKEGGLLMIILQEKKEEKVLCVFVVPGDEMDVETIPWYQSEVERYSKQGYSINSVIYPDTGCLPEEVQETYNQAYVDKALLDRLIYTATDDLLYTVLTEVVRQEIKKFKIEDIVDALKE